MCVNGVCVDRGDRLPRCACVNACCMRVWTVWGLQQKSSAYTKLCYVKQGLLLNEKRSAWTCWGSGVKFSHGSTSSWWRSYDRTNRPFAQLWPGNEVRGIAGEIRLRCVRFSLELSFFFCFGMSFSDHCCVPRFFNRGRAGPSLFSHGFSRSSELRKRWLLAIRQADWSHFRVPNNTVVWARPPCKNFSLSCSCLRACGLFHHQFFETE